jgi:nucleoside-diphosphate-sugar epimerase
MAAAIKIADPRRPFPDLTMANRPSPTVMMSLIQENRQILIYFGDTRRIDFILQPTGATILLSVRHVCCHCRLPQQQHQLASIDTRTMPDKKTCVVLGGSSQAGSWLVPSLIESGWTVHLVSRGLKPQFDYGPNGIWHNLDLRSMDALFPAVEARVVFDTLGIFSDWLERMRGAGVGRVISFSSTSVFTKADSTDPIDIRSVHDMQKREQAFADSCSQLRIDWTILRPTLIYGGKFGDRTVKDIARVIRLFGFFPVFGSAAGLRQPVHADDLARACMHVCDNEATFNRSYNVGGGEILSYRGMVERIFASIGRPPRIVRIPLPAFELGARVVRLHPRYRHIRSSMAERMEKDMTFSNAEAISDFEYAPRRFEPSVQVATSLPNRSRESLRREVHPKN